MNQTEIRILQLNRLNAIFGLTANLLTEKR
jgi:hypothetical protein